jgi:hypothetical protein
VFFSRRLSGAHRYPPEFAGEFCSLPAVIATTSSMLRMLLSSLSLKTSRTLNAVELDILRRFVVEIWQQNGTLRWDLKTNDSCALPPQPLGRGGNRGHKEVERTTIYSISTTENQY